jgi:tetratricopeptide (TPR) repeat protein
MKKISKIKYFIVLLFCFLILSSCQNKKINQYKSYGIDYLENNNYEEALSYFDEALKLGDGEVSSTQYELLLYKAECLFMLNRYDEAKKIYETLKVIDKNNKTFNELYNNLSTIVNLVDFRLAIDKGELDRADSILVELKNIGLEHEKSVMYNQAVLYEKKGEWKNALNAFNYYLKQYPGDENALHEVEFINAQLNNGNN